MAGGRGFSGLGVVWAWSGHPRVTTGPKSSVSKEAVLTRTPTFGPAPFSGFSGLAAVWAWSGLPKLRKYAQIVLTGLPKLRKYA